MAFCSSLPGVCFQITDRLIMSAMMRSVLMFNGNLGNSLWLMALGGPVGRCVSVMLNKNIYTEVIAVDLDISQAALVCARRPFMPRFYCSDGNIVRMFDKIGLDNIPSSLSSSSLFSFGFFCCARKDYWSPIVLVFVPVYGAVSGQPEHLTCVVHYLDAC